MSVTYVKSETLKELDQLKCHKKAAGPSHPAT